MQTFGWLLLVFHFFSFLSPAINWTNTLFFPAKAIYVEGIIFGSIKQKEVKFFAMLFPSSNHIFRGFSSSIWFQINIYCALYWTIHINPAYKHILEVCVACCFLQQTNTWNEFPLHSVWFQPWWRSIKPSRHSCSFMGWNGWGSLVGLVDGYFFSGLYIVPKPHLDLGLYWFLC